MKETGRAGHDGLSAVCTLFCTNVDVWKLEDMSMKEYCKNKPVVDEFLLKDFDAPHSSDSTTTLVHVVTYVK